jgi:hypothetical protein
MSIGNGGDKERISKKQQTCKEKENGIENLAITDTF